MRNESLVPLYQQIKEDIKSSIESGVYVPRQKIPSEPELSAKYNASRITIRRAVDELSADGYLIKMQGRGTFVGTPRIHRKITESNRIESFTNTCKSNGMTAGGRLIRHQIIPAQSDERSFLSLKKDALLLYIQRVRTADGEPVFLENLFLPYDKYQAIAERDDLGTVSMFQAIEAISGTRPVGAARRTVEATRATGERASMLNVPIGEPLLHVNVYFTDTNQKPVFIGRQYYIGSRYMFEL
ncbi:MAG: GntR family transcriptional regulator [Planctomycetaceae bacterium]|nr:GntR family transcriptional regulator [Planctomycetaceae bacterium]